MDLFVCEYMQQNAARSAYFLHHKPAGFSAAPDKNKEILKKSCGIRKMPQDVEDIKTPFSLEWIFKKCKSATTSGNLLAAHKLLAYGGEVHGLLDDFSVAGDRFQVDGCEERPCILMPLQLSKKYSGQHTCKHKQKTFIELSCPCKLCLFLLCAILQINAAWIEVNSRTILNRKRSEAVMINHIIFFSSLNCDC